MTGWVEARRSTQISTQNLGRDHGTRRPPGAQQGGPLARHVQGGGRPLPVRRHLQHRGAGARGGFGGRAARPDRWPRGGRVGSGHQRDTDDQGVCAAFLRHHRVEGNTRERYADTLRLHVIPFLGGCRLAETDRTVARNYITVLEEEGRSANTIRQAKVVLCAMFGMAVADGYVDYNPFHDVKIPKVPGRRAIKVATPEQYLTVRACLPNKPAQVFSTLLVSSGIRFCEAIGLQPDDFDFEAGILEVARSVVKVSREHHPRGKTFLVP